MRYILLTFALGLSTQLAQPQMAIAQTQQAGADGGKAEEAFQALIDKCDNVDLLVKRGKVRLILGRIDEGEAAKAQAKINEAFAKCGEGNVVEADKILDEAFVIADAASTATFGTDSSAEPVAKATETASKASDQSDDKPWWKFW